MQINAVTMQINIKSVLRRIYFRNIFRHYNLSQACTNAKYADVHSTHQRLNVIKSNKKTTIMLIQGQLHDILTF